MQHTNHTSPPIMYPCPPTPNMLHAPNQPAKHTAPYHHSTPNPYYAPMSPHYMVPPPGYVQGRKNTPKASTDTLYIILAILSVICLGLSTYMFAQANKKTDIPEPTVSPIAAPMAPKTDFYQTDDESEKVQIFSPEPLGLPMPSALSESVKSMTYLHSGARISIQGSEEGGSLCTLTVINPSYGITAGHCGNIGDVVRAISKNNQSIYIGNITYDLLPENYDDEMKADGSLDVAVIAFTRDVVGFADEVNRELPAVGDTVSIFGQRSKGSQGHVLNLDGVEDSKVPSFTTDALVRSGDSGGPVYDENGRIMGIVQYSFDSGVSGITPMKNICDRRMQGVRCDSVQSVAHTNPDIGR